ncbi:GNAT family N-acetyltransferase [Puniceicoccaceae bacterium K14]|nr:GNAT family N-acetyltransferase [Puniceicoccaceae bacterium K14]
MDYKIKEEIPPVSDYIEIRLKAGLSRKSEKAARVGLSNSIHSVVAYCENERIGIGRVIGDGGCFFEITDVAVLPDHQGKGVGRLIMESLVDFLEKNAPSTAFVSLFADHGTPEFYSKYGFSKAELPKSAGMYMRIT